MPRRTGPELALQAWGPLRAASSTIMSRRVGSTPGWRPPPPPRSPPHTTDQDVEATLGLSAAALGAVPRGPRSTSDWDVLAVGVGAGAAAAHCSQAGLSVYTGRYAGSDGAIDDLGRVPFWRVLCGLAVRRAIKFWFFAVPGAWAIGSRPNATARRRHVSSVVAAALARRAV